MLGSLFQSTTLPALEQVVHFAQARHSVLAGNIANLDVPGYRARDLSVGDFQARLKEAIDTQRRQPSALSPGETIFQPARKTAEVSEVNRTILRHDDGNVGLEHEVTEMVKNQIQHNLALAVMASQFRLLQAAISERV
jgi:flagellar basal-body rod protein FlgB